MDEILNGIKVIERFLSLDYFWMDLLLFALLISNSISC